MEWFLIKNRNKFTLYYAKLILGEFTYEVSNVN
jgi:hypothetical protein